MDPIKESSLGIWLPLEGSSPGMERRENHAPDHRQHGPAQVNRSREHPARKTL